MTSVVVFSMVTLSLQYCQRLRPSEMKFQESGVAEQRAMY